MTENTANPTAAQATQTPPNSNPYLNQQPYSYAPQPQPKKKKGKSWIFILLVIIVLVAGAGLGFGYAFGGQMELFPEEPYIASLFIEGTISGEEPLAWDTTATYSQDYLIDTLSALIEDENNAGLLLYIDSPGGTVYEVDELSALLDEYAATGRPIYAYCGSYAASGGYWLACKADAIYANRNCITGSIGVTMGAHIDISGFLEKNGVGVTQITTGDNKAMGSIYAPLTEEQYQIYLSLMEEDYQLFLQVVADGRGMTVDEVRPLADGRVYTTSQAVNLGLMDGVSTYQETATALRVAAGYDHPLPLIELKYVNEGNMFSPFLSLLHESKKSELDAYLEAALPVNGPAAYFYGF